ncbi:MAG: porin [Bacteroidia bacterium]|nr:porin [Bacteroidia bacterium]
MMKTIYKFVLLFVLASLVSIAAHGQYSPDYKGGLKVSLNDEGTKYVRFITWHQMWATFSNDQVNFSLRRSRFLAFAKINDRFLILTHFGLNNLSPAQMGTAAPVPSGSGNGRFFMHDAWADVTVVKGYLNVGAGLHYWNGISRLNNQSTLNFLTLDAPGHNWATIGTSDQFARHLGVFAKGKLGKLDYRFAVNEAIQNPLLGGSLSNITNGSGDTTTFVTNKAVYRNEANPGGGKIVSGYVKYDFFDKEGNTLPYFVGTYMGKKKILNVGAGFFYHADGASYYESAEAGTAPTLVSPTSFAVDVFADLPLKGKTMGFTGYASFTNHSWGPNLTGGLDGVGTGNITYAQAGLALKEIKNVGQFQPYVHFTNRSLEAHSDFTKSNSTRLGVGANWFIEGHNLKVSAEFQTSTGTGATATPDAANLFRIQLHALI